MTNKVLRYINVLRSQFLYQAVFAFIVVTIVIPALVYFLVYDLGEEPVEELSTCVIQFDYRVPCGFVPGRALGNLTAYNCHNRDCCFDNFTQTCFHYLPSKYEYRNKEGEDYGYTVKNDYTPFGTPTLKNVSIKISPISENINYIEASLKKEGAVIRDVDPHEDNYYQEPCFQGVVCNISKTALTLDIYREDAPAEMILTTTLGPLIASEGYWEWSMQMTNRNGTMYGLGGLEITGNVSKVIYRNEREQSNVPFFLAQKETPKGLQYHALLVQHTGALEVDVLESNLIILRGLMTDGFTLRLFPGPSLEDVRRQLSNSYVPEVVPRWLLGTHICRNSVTDFGSMVQEFVNEQQLDSFQADSDCFNEMLMILLIELYDEPITDRETYVRDMVQKHLKTKFVLPLTPHIPKGVKATETKAERTNSLFKKAEDMEVLLKNAKQEIHIGHYKNREVAFLDPYAPRAAEFLRILLDIVNSRLIPYSSIDGVFLLDNWPQDDSYNFSATKEYFPYYHENITMALNRTPAMLLEDQENYVKKQIEVVRDVVSTAIGKDIPILSSTHYYGLGTPMLPQYVNRTWMDMKDIITRTLFANMFTHPISLTPVCGTNSWLNDTANENEICARWFINQAMLPGQRVTTNWYTHGNFTKASRNIVLKAVELKKTLSYYKYGQYREHGQVIKPMFLDFPNDNATWSLDDQYLLGDLVVVPILLPKLTLRRFYLPVNYTWFEFWGGMKLIDSGWQNLSVSKDERLMFLKEGSLVHIIKETSTAEASFELVAARRCIVGRQAIQGSIYFDNHALKLEILDRFMQISNIVNVKEDINCAAPTKKNHPYVISKLKLYECQKKDATIYNINFDICAKNNNDIEHVVIRNHVKSNF